MIKRRKTKSVKIGSVKVGGTNPVSIQSMAKTATDEVAKTVRQIKALEKAGCDIVRVALKNRSDVSLLSKIRAKIGIPLVADIHFNYRLALEAIECGVDAVRLNPGNIYRREEVKAVAAAARKRKIPIRVGVNSGSLRVMSYPPALKLPPSPRLRRTGRRVNELGVRKLDDLMVKSALNYIKMLESFSFYDIIVSLKASTVAATVNAYRKMAKLCRYPFHLGITASGLPGQGGIKSAIGIGSLLLEGIGDTIRVSLAGNPLEEVKVAKEILQSLRLGNFGPEIVACPTCGRTQVDVIKIAKQVKNKLPTLYSLLSTSRPFTIAIMGCEVNGPGEARDADIGVAGGKNCAVLFKKGKIIKRIKEDQIVNTLIAELVKG